MLGSPLMRAVVALAILLALLAPLRSFTAARAEAQPVKAAAATPETLAHLQIVSTKAPFTYSVAYLGKTIWQGAASDSTAATDLKLPIPSEGIDLALDVHWRDGGTAAAKLSLSHDDNAPADRTVWGEGEASDVLTFP